MKSSAQSSASPDAASGHSAKKATTKITYKLVTLAALLDLQSTRMYHRHGLSVVDWRILNHLAEQGARYHHQLCTSAVVDRALVTRRVQYLERHGWVDVATDPLDTRRRIVSLTLAGRRLYRRIVPLSDARQHALADLLGPGAMRQFEATVEKIEYWTRTQLQVQSDDAAPQRKNRRSK